MIKGTTNFDILNAVYPVGSIYMSVNSANPSTIFGGTWVAWGQGRVPVCVDASSDYFGEVEMEGGQEMVQLTTNEMPQHAHMLNLYMNGNTAAGNRVSGNDTYGGSATAAGMQAVGMSNTGGGSPHTNLQPYITCYMWKRTA